MRPFKTGQVWARNVTEEFYQQGDREKREGLPVSMFCDREKGNLAASQVGFISSIVKPYIDMLIDVFPKLYSLSENVNRALLEWGKLKDLSSVSYTHLTLPTILLVQISVVAVSLKKKKKN
eukprot:TRINITY_DN18289_c0_g1_i4.p2 TRINITY_DN18289_c0_g1~~TRINITY_DN18289_c0_g1_i4.p2  ORF type:complete len:121 (-),score=23.06 TRINITY_DN18289_c0_g1_i4:102-464(-)